MLKNIPPILSPELLKVLAEMGHGDRICIGDGNFPGASMAKPNNCVFPVSYTHLDVYKRQHRGIPPCAGRLSPAG